MNLQRSCAAIALAAWATLALALPTVADVQAEVQRGNYTHAQTMMQEVINAKPGSARAHYLYAEILAHNRQFDEAAQQAASARRIDPAIHFADPEKFSAFEQLLQREQQAATQARQRSERALSTATPLPVERPGGGMPAWVWIVGLAAAAGLLWRLFARRAAAVQPSVMAPAPGYATTPYGNPMANPYAPAPASGGGLMGVGLAAAGGVAAGMLAERLLGQGHDHGAGSAAAVDPSHGGLVPGMFDDAGAGDEAARALAQRDIDFGSGDGWGDDAPSSSDDGW